MRGQYVKLMENTNLEEQLKPRSMSDEERIKYVEGEREKGNLGYHPEDTAMDNRKGASTVFGAIVAYNEQVKKKGGEGIFKEGMRILHAGAGDPSNPDRASFDDLVKEFNGEVYHYDPGHGNTDRSPLQKGDFDIVVSPFVLNVLSSEDRKSPIEDIIKSVKADGYAFIGTRGEGDVIPATPENKEKKPKWTLWDDGWLVPSRKSVNVSFQKGITPEMIKEYFGKHFSEIKVKGKGTVLASLKK